MTGGVVERLAAVVADAERAALREGFERGWKAAMRFLSELAGDGSGRDPKSCGRVSDMLDSDPEWREIVEPVPAAAVAEPVPESIPEPAPEPPPSGESRFVRAAEIPSFSAPPAKPTPVAADPSWRWTAERDAALRKDYPTGVPIGAIDARLRALPGSAGGVNAVWTRANALRLRRQVRPLPPLPPEVAAAAERLGVPVAPPKRKRERESPSAFAIRMERYDAAVRRGTALGRSAERILDDVRTFWPSCRLIPKDVAERAAILAAIDERDPARPLPPLPPEIAGGPPPEQPLPAPGPDGVVPLPWSLLRRLAEREGVTFVGGASVEALNALRARRGEPPVALAS